MIGPLVLEKDRSFVLRTNRKGRRLKLKSAFPSIRSLYNQRGSRSGGWVATNRKRLGKSATKAAKRARQRERRLAAARRQR